MFWLSILPADRQTDSMKGRNLLLKNGTLLCLFVVRLLEPWMMEAYLDKIA